MGKTHGKTYSLETKEKKRREKYGKKKRFSKLREVSCISQKRTWRDHLVERNKNTSDGKGESVYQKRLQGKTKMQRKKKSLGRKRSS